MEQKFGFQAGEKEKHNIEVVCTVSLLSGRTKVIVKVDGLEVASGPYVKEGTTFKFSVGRDEVHLVEVRITGKLAWHVEGIVDDRSVYSA